jgi:hypothetical protein
MRKCNSNNMLLNTLQVNEEIEKENSKRSSR